VGPSEGSAELSSAERITAYTGEAAIEDQDNDEVDITVVEVGDRVVTFQLFIAIYCHYGIILVG